MTWWLVTILLALAAFGIGCLVGDDRGTTRTNREWIEHSKKPRVPYPKVGGG